jgi:hypothetical protein
MGRHLRVVDVRGPIKKISALATGGGNNFQTSTSEKMLSQYELDRLDNIARNKAVLEALGLEDGLIGKSKEKSKARAAPKSKSDDDDDDVTEPVAVRRSSRHTGKVKHVELTDEDMLAEEREILRPKRATRVVSRFEDRQAAELQEREKRVEQKRNLQRQRVAQEAAATKAAKEAAKQAAAVAQAKVFMAQRSVNPCTPRGPMIIAGGKVPVAPYPTKGKKYTCEFCRGEFVETKNGGRHHTCISIDTTHLPM